MTSKFINNRTTEEEEVEAEFILVSKKNKRRNDVVKLKTIPSTHLLYENISSPDQETILR